jgi:hypothetical protein
MVLTHCKFYTGGVMGKVFCADFVGKSKTQFFHENKNYNNNVPKNIFLPQYLDICPFCNCTSLILLSIELASFRK